MQAAGDFARQAVARWRGYADESLAAASQADAAKRSREAPAQEFAALLVLKAEWWFDPQQPIAFAYIRRTWTGSLYLEFMAGHPLTEGRVTGILRATLRCLAVLADASGAGWVWWEATKDSFPKYDWLVTDGNALSDCQPRIQDVFVVRATMLEDLLNRKQKPKPTP